MNLSEWLAQWKVDAFVMLTVIFSLVGAMAVTLIWTLPIGIVASFLDNSPSKNFAFDWGMPAWMLLGLAFGPGIFRKMLNSFKRKESDD